MIVGDDGVCPGCDRDLRDHVVSRITQEWAPQKKDLLVSGDAADVVEDVADFRDPERTPVAQQCVLVFQNEGHRHRDLESVAPESLEKCERSAATRSDRRHQHIRVEYDEGVRHHGMVSSAIPPRNRKPPPALRTLSSAAATDYQGIKTSASRVPSAAAS